MSNRPIRILLADDHVVVRTGLAHVINARPEFEVVGEVETGEEALVACQNVKPDIVLMDVRMRGMGGVGATQAIARYYPNISVIGLSTFGDRDTTEGMMAAGAKGFLSKTVSMAELIDAMERVHAGNLVVNSGPGYIDGAGPVSDMETPLQELTQQQKRVLALLSKGCTNNEIASYLNVSLPTARYHVSAILVKLGVSNRAEAAAMAVRHNLIGRSDF